VVDDHVILLEYVWKDIRVFPGLSSFPVDRYLKGVQVPIYNPAADRAEKGSPFTISADSGENFSIKINYFPVRLIFMEVSLCTMGRSQNAVGLGKPPMASAPELIPVF
jgi:hypothetical protein